MGGVRGGKQEGEGDIGTALTIHQIIFCQDKRLVCAGYLFAMEGVKPLYNIMLFLNKLLMNI